MDVISDPCNPGKGCCPPEWRVVVPVVEVELTGRRPPPGDNEPTRRPAAASTHCHHHTGPGEGDEQCFKKVYPKVRNLLVESGYYRFHI